MVVAVLLTVQMEESNLVIPKVENWLGNGWRAVPGDGCGVRAS